MTNAELTVDQLHDAFLQAERLRQEPAFAAALTALRREALDQLVAIEATETDKIRDAQAMVRAIDGITTKIGQAILRWKSLPEAQRVQVSA